MSPEQVFSSSRNIPTLQIRSINAHNFTSWKLQLVCWLLMTSRHLLTPDMTCGITPFSVSKKLFSLVTAALKNLWEGTRYHRPWTKQKSLNYDLKFTLKTDAHSKALHVWRYVISGIFDLAETGRKYIAWQHGSTYFCCGDDYGKGVWWLVKLTVSVSHQSHIFISFVLFFN